MKYVYRALYQKQEVTGHLEAMSEKEVVEYLRNNKYFPLDIKRTSEGRIVFLSSLLERVTNDDIIAYFRQVGIMLNAGMTITGAHDILVEQINKQSLRDLIMQISTSIKSGKSYSSALAQTPGMFPKLVVSLVTAGEVSGKLNEILLKLSDDLEKQRDFKSRFKSAMTYPVIVMVGVVAVVFILITFVVPQLLGLYTELNIELPVTTQILMSMSTFSAKWWPLILVGVGGGVYALRKRMATESGQWWYYTTIMNIPIVGPLVKVAGLVIATRTLSLLLTAGVLVLDSINIVVDATANVIFQKAFRNVYLSIQKGLTISQGFEKEGVFPPVLVQMAAVGERTGKLDEILLKISEYFESETNNAMKALTTAIEPMILVVMGGVVLFIVMAVLSPIYNLTSQIGN